MRREVALVLVGCALFLSACGGREQPAPTLVPEQSFASVVSVTGEVLPAEWATVSAQAGGAAVDVLVKPGDAVVAGETLLRLDPADAELAAQQAEVALEAARRQLALLQSRPRAEEVAVAEARAEAAKPAVDQAEARLAQLRAGSLDAEIAAAKAQWTQQEIAELESYQFHEDTKECFNVTIPGKGKREICPLLGPIEEKARFRMQAEREALEAVETRYSSLVAQRVDRLRAAELDVQRAKEQLAAAEAEVVQAQAGASPEELAAAEAGIREAETALEKAKVALERSEIRAPLGGVVGMVRVRENELVVPGQPVVTIGDLATLRVETTDLDEIDVARVNVGQRADVTFDAVPDRVFEGRVARISPMAEASSGGVNYTTVVEMESLAPEIRWGMTAFVDIEVGD